MTPHAAMTEVRREHKVQLLREMLRIRRLEEKAAELYSAAKIRGFLHLYIGEEAVGVGVMQALTPQDAVVATYREHGQALARGVSAKAIMAEMYGKQEGCSRGRGGSMHLFDAKTGFYGGNAIVGGGLPLAVGIALADQMKRDPFVTCCFFGDGARPDLEQRRDDSAHVRRPVQRPGCHSHGYRRRTSGRRAAFAQPGGVVCPYPRHQSGDSGHGRRCARNAGHGA